jgi:hypothetical protein
MVKVNGSVSQPSLSLAYIYSSTQPHAATSLETTCRLYVKMTIDQDSLFLWVFSDPTENSRGQLQSMALQLLSAKIHSFRGHTEGFELIFHERCHLENILSVGGIATDTVEIKVRSALNQMYDNITMLLGTFCHVPVHDLEM